MNESKSTIDLCFVFVFFRTIQDPASQRLTWYKPPLTVLIIKKIHDAAVISPFIQLVSWFTELKRYSEIVSLFTCNIFLAVKNRPKFTNLPNSGYFSSMKSSNMFIGFAIILNFIFYNINQLKNGGVCGGGNHGRPSPY